MTEETPVNSGHTPGPWKASYTMINEVRSSEGALIAKCEKLNGLVTMQANARVIAASPVLFSIVQRLAALSDGLANGNSSAEHQAGLLAEEARAAILSATGG